ncbi:MAG: hypothetical protein EXS18_07740 [Verrucomicrobiae bacterium]|nr:hypothetical protein [Verrucomicrobiae bacterium]
MSEWSQAQPEAERRKRRRRVIGLVMILMSIGLVLLGQLALEPYLRENLVRFIVYWSACALFTVAALFTALIDMVAVRSEAAREERRLTEHTFRRRKAAHDNSEDDDSGEEEKN